MLEDNRALCQFLFAYLNIRRDWNTKMKCEELKMAGISDDG
jgi:hypothetical protein